MADLGVSDVVSFTGGRLTDDTATTGQTKRMLDAALAIARREVGWHVSPARDETVTLDGPDSRVLWLPTLKLNTLTSVTENGVTQDLTKIARSAGEGPGLVRRAALRKKSRGYWSDQYGSIVVQMNHGFTETEAADWRQGILSLVDQISLIPVKASTGMSDFGQSSVRIDDVQIGYNPYATIAQEVVFSIAHILDDYMLRPMEYL